MEPVQFSRNAGGDLHRHRCSLDEAKHEDVETNGIQDVDLKATDYSEAQQPHDSDAEDGARWGPVAGPSQPWWASSDAASMKRVPTAESSVGSASLSSGSGSDSDSWSSAGSLNTASSDRAEQLLLEVRKLLPPAAASAGPHEAPHYTRSETNKLGAGRSACFEVRHPDAAELAAANVFRKQLVGLRHQYEWKDIPLDFFVDEMVDDDDHDDDDGVGHGSVDWDEETNDVGFSLTSIFKAIMPCAALFR